MLWFFVLFLQTSKKLKKSQCTPLFLTCYQMRGTNYWPYFHSDFMLDVDSKSIQCSGAGAVIHTHSKAAVMATLVSPGKEFRITHQEMIKGIERGQTGEKMR